MPAPTTLSRCTFTGIAQSIHILGSGPAVLADRAPFSSGHAARVELLGASVAASPSPVIDHPADLDPVNMNPDGAIYDVTYTAGPPIIIQIAHGGAIGHFQGNLPNAPTCADARGCDITWPGARTVVLHRADQSRMQLTGAFPFGDPDPLARKQPVVEEVTLRKALGTLSCPERDKALNGDFTWTVGPHRMLTVAPIRLERGTLAVTVANEAPPEPLGLSTAALAGRVALAAALLLALVAGAVVFFRKRKRPPPATRPA